MESLLIGCLFFLLLVIAIGLIHRPKMKSCYFQSTTQRIGRISLPNFELIDCNLPLAEEIGFQNCEDCLQNRIEVDIDLEANFKEPIICQLRMGDESLKLVKILAIEHVENQYLDFMVIKEPESLDLFSQLPIPILKLNGEMVILDLNSSATEVFGKDKKGLALSAIIRPSLRIRISNILIARNRRHRIFSLAVPVVSASGERITQLWRFLSKNTEEMILSCFPIWQNKEEKWLFYEQVYPGQSVFWALDLTDSSFRYDDIGDVWKDKFNLPRRASLKGWLNMVHPQDRERVNREFESFLLHPKSRLNCTYRMASMQGLELNVTSIGSHLESGEMGANNDYLAKGIHQIIEPFHTHDHPNSSPFNDNPYTRFSALCRSMGFRTSWLSSDNKVVFPANIDFRKILESILGDARDVKEISVETVHLRDQKMHCVSCGECIKGEQITITLKISNLGFPPRHLKQILRYGYRTQDLLDTDSKELGIEGLMHIAGGHFTVHAVEGNMVFVLFLPIKGKISIKGDTENKCCSIEPGSQALSLLIIDDQEIVLRYLCETLSLKGYQVTGISNAAKALKHFEDDPFKYDLVITDQNMEELSGTELIKTMLSRRPDLPIVLCSGENQPTANLSPDNLDAVTFFRKPLDMPKLDSFCRAQIASSSGYSKSKSPR